MSALISTDELKDIIGNPDVKLFDATYPRQMAEPIRIPGAQVFDIDDIADPDADFKHTLPTPDLFQEKMRDLGLNAGDTVVVYDQKGMFMAAARAWWMLRVFGHDNVRVLNGGFPQWLAHGNEIEQMVETHPAKGDFVAEFKADLVKTLPDMMQNLEDANFTVIDARSADRFESDGHIPNSHSLFFGGFINHDNGKIVDKDKMQDYWQSANINDKNLVASCGSGVTACVDALALYELGYKDVAVYDGSWTEWSSRSDTPKA